MNKYDSIDDIKRIESKLDLIIQHFSIGQKPPRSQKSLEDLAIAKVFSLQKRRKKSNKRNVCAKNQGKQISDRHIPGP